MLSYQQNALIFADRHKNINDNDIGDYYVFCGSSHMVPGLHFQNV